MSENVSNPRVDFYFAKPGPWQDEINLLRSIVLECELREELKWGCPCYTWQDHNIVLIHVFKNYCALLFFKGALMKDAKKILVHQTKQVQAARQLRFKDTTTIAKLRATIRSYIKEAVRIERSGRKVELRKTSEYPVPDEFRELLKDPGLKAAFHALTPGRQRAYLLYFSSAKQSETRLKRIGKFREQIMRGKGLNDT